MASAPVYALPGVIVVQPPHLEGDATLATEILPGPPPLVSLQQKRDPKKPSPVFSYLPASDPGSTYSGNMAGTSILGVPDVDGPRRKRARIDKGSATGRAQRASARNVTTAPLVPDVSASDRMTAALSMQSIMDLDSLVIPVDSNPSSISRSNSAANLEDGLPSASNGKTKGTRKDKGKGKEMDKALIRVKEEEMAPPSLSPDSAAGPLNEDHCSACSYQGSLVYCDGCPRAYHLWCLDPPMEPSDIPEGDKWFCSGCTFRKNPPPKPASSLMSPLLIQVQTSASMPREYQIPDDIRNFFKDVGAGPRGSYMDTSETKKPRLNHYGQVEDREPYRLKDRNNAPVLCFRCGTSALPDSSAPAGPTSKRPRRSIYKASSALESGKPIVSCDYCSLHWHLDCLDPPLASMPSYQKKWMCPNHADQALLPKRRIPRQNAPPIEITQPNQFNNGNIEVIHPQAASASQSKVVVDEVLINGRRYRVPERVIMLDFWNKISINRNQGANGREAEVASAMSSPLTSLSSLGDLDEITVTHLDPSIPFAPSQPDPDIVTVAQLLCGLRTQSEENHTIPNGARPDSTEATVQVQAKQPPSVPIDRPRRTLPAKRTPHHATPNGRQVHSLKPTQTGPLTKRPSRTIKTEPEEAYKIPPELEQDSFPNKQQPKAKVEDSARSSRNLRLRVKKDSLAVKQKPSTPTAAPAIPSGVMHPPILMSAPATASVPSTPPSRAAIPQTTTPTTPSLKIRLPRLGALNLQSQSAPVQPLTRSSSPSSGQTSTDSRLRRSSRQRLSTSASMSSKSSSSSSLGGLLTSRPNGAGAPSTPPRLG